MEPSGRAVERISWVSDGGALQSMRIDYKSTRLPELRSPGDVSRSSPSAVICLGGYCADSVARTTQVSELGANDPRRTHQGSQQRARGLEKV